LNLKRFFLYSGVVHALVIAALIFLVHPVKEKKAGAFYTSLVSPEELLPRRPVNPPPPRVRSMPGRRSVPPRPSARIRPVPSRPSAPAAPGITAPAPPGHAEENVLPEKAVPSPRPPSLPSRPEPGGGSEKGREGQNQAEKGSSLRERLFDKNVIANLAKRDIAREEEKENKNKNFTFDTKEYRFLLYNRRLRERIESIWVYPPYEAEHGIYGDLEIRFTIKKNGQLGSVELLRTSGHKSLDDAAIKALKDGAPYWPLPDEWGMEAYTIDGHFIYTIYGNLIR
jgi:protein TonB